MESEEVPMNALDLLHEDHERVSSLFGELKSVTDEHKRGVFARLEHEILLHARAEEMIFYPAIPSAEVAHAKQEHSQVAELLAKLSAGTVETDAWMTGVKELERNVKHHVEEEESSLFDAARTLGDEKLEELGRRIEKFKAEEKV
jgi:hemerythrin superfamily protein